MLEFVYSVVIIGLSLKIPDLLLKGDDRRYHVALTKLILYHFLISIVFYFFSLNADGYTYWMNSKDMTFDDFVHNITGELGTYFMDAFNYFPASVLGMGFFSNTIFYGAMGALGISYFFVITLRTVPYNSAIRGVKLFPLLFYSPNLHFWSGGIGKDTLLFLCIGMFAYALMNPARRVGLIVISLALSYAVRPHVMLFMLLGFGVAYLFGSKISKVKKIAFSTLFIVLAIVLLPKIMQYVSLDTLSFSGISDRAKDYSGKLGEGAGSAVDISGYPFPLKVFTFWFRPLFFDAHNIISLLSSMENILLLLLVLNVIFKYPIITYKQAPFIIKGLMVTLFIGTLLFSQTLGNLGIMVRMKNMFLPGLLIYILWAYSLRRTIQLKGKH